MRRPLLHSQQRDVVELLREACTRVGTPQRIVHYWGEAHPTASVPLFTELIHSQPFSVQQEVLARLVNDQSKLPVAEAEAFFSSYSAFLESYVKPMVTGCALEDAYKWLSVVAQRWKEGGKDGSEVLDVLESEGIDSQQQLGDRGGPFEVNVSWVNSYKESPEAPSGGVGVKRHREESEEGDGEPAAKQRRPDDNDELEREGTVQLGAEDTEMSPAAAVEDEEDIYLQADEEDWRAVEILNNASDEEQKPQSLAVKAAPTERQQVSPQLLQLAEELKEGLAEVVLSQDSQDVFGTQGQGGNPFAEMVTFLQTNQTHLEVIMRHLQLSELDEGVFIALTEKLFGIEKKAAPVDLMGALECQTFVKLLLLPRIAGLEASASRLMLSMFLQISETYPAQVLRGLLVPLSQSSSALRPPQTELITRLMKGSFLGRSNELILEFLKEALASQSTMIWNEPVIKMLNDIAALQIPLGEASVRSFANACKVRVKDFKTSMKFVTLIFTLARKHGPSVQPVAGLLRDVVAETKTSMTKTATKTLEKLI